MCYFFVLTVFWLKLWSILEQIYCTMESICKLQQRVWMSHTWLTCFPPNNFGLLQVSWSLMKELRKKRKNATPKVSCVLVHFSLKRKYKLALTSEQLCAQCISSEMRLQYQMPALLIILKNCEKREMFYPKPSISFLFLVFTVMSWMFNSCL